MTQSSQVDPNDVLLVSTYESLVKTMQEGDAKYGSHSWLSRPDSEDLDHIQAHIMAFASGDRSERHLEHVITRCGMMLARQELVKLGVTYERVPFGPGSSST
jgi:hypothetical protein